MTYQLLKHISLLTALLLSLPMSARLPERPDLDEAAHVGVYIYDIKNSRELVATNAAQAFSPASTMKSLTTATVMLTIGPDYRFETPVRLIGERADGRFTGVLEVQASGDPTIGSRHFSRGANMVDSIVAALTRRGIKEFDGVIRVDESRFTTVGPRGRWQVHDVAWEYGAAFFGFNYADNITTLNLQTMKVPRGSGLTVERGRRSGSVDLTRGVGSDVLVVDGAATSGMEWTTVPDPAYCFTSALMDKMSAAGIQLNIRDDAKGLPNTSTETIYTQVSPRAYDICKSLMSRSDNMFADAMQRAISKNKSLSAAVKTLEDTWRSAGVNLGPHHIYDGSGLIRNDALTPRGLGRVLTYMAGNKNYYTTFPVCGREGTVKSFLTGTSLAGGMALKSGSMSGVRCYAGYKLGADGAPTHVVVLMVNNSFRSTAEVKGALTKYLVRVFGEIASGNTSTPAADDDATPAEASEVQ